MSQESSERRETLIQIEQRDIGRISAKLREEARDTEELKIYPELWRMMPSFEA